MYGKSNAMAEVVTGEPGEIFPASLTAGSTVLYGGARILAFNNAAFEDFGPVMTFHTPGTYRFTAIGYALSIGGCSVQFTKNGVVEGAVITLGLTQTVITRDITVVAGDVIRMQGKYNSYTTSGYMNALTVAVLATTMQSAIDEVLTIA